jgi:hypothetical protein
MLEPCPDLHFIPASARIISVAYPTMYGCEIVHHARWVATVGGGSSGTCGTNRGAPRAFQRGLGPARPAAMDPAISVSRRARLLPRLLGGYGLCQES